MIFRKDIEGLRGFSIIYVILYHYYPNIFNGGVFGVDIFFVISGFVITNSLMNNKTTVLSFYQKRVNRIYPAAYICLFWIVIDNNRFIKSINNLKDIISAILFYANIRFYYSSVDYFSDSNSPILHYWSLSIENQFYILYPIVRNLFKNHIWYGLIVLFLFSFYHLLSNYISFPEYSYFFTFTRVWEILIGCIISYMVESYSQIYKNKRRIIFCVMMIIFLCICFIGDKYFVIPGPYSLIPTIISSIICIDPENDYAKYILANSVIRFFGVISYSLYLYHYPVKSFKIKTKDKIIISMIFSILSYKFIEKPFQQIKISKSTNLLILFIIIFIFIDFINKRIIVNFKKNILYIDKSYYNCIWKVIRFSNNIDYSSIKYIFIGDSHLTQYYPSLQYLLRYPTFHFLISFWGIYNNEESVFHNMIKIFNKIEIIFVSFLIQLSVFNKTKAEIEIILLSYFKLLLKYSKKVIFIQDNPYLDFNPFEGIKNDKNTFVIGVNASRVYLDIIHPKVTILNPFSLFCPNRKCNFVYNNISLYIDSHHLNGMLIKNRVIEYFYRILKIPIECNNRTNIYQCELRQYGFMNYESKKFAVSIKIKVLKSYYPKPIVYNGEMII